MKFEWEPEKAMRVFKDALAFTFDDEEHLQMNTAKSSSAHQSLAGLSLYVLWRESRILSVFSAPAAQLGMRSRTMKKTPGNKPARAAEMSTEYRFNYKKAKPNRFADRMKDSPLVVVLDPDVAKVFTSTEEVNKALRAIISAIPEHHATPR
jgi:hypothetical protein